MSNTFGTALRVTVFGQSHAPAMGAVADGLPAGEAVDLTELQSFLSRRAPGQNAYSTPRKEPDVPEILAGLKDGKTCGAPLSILIRNTNVRSGDYASFADVPRPGHADYTARVKYGESYDNAGGGQFSGRLTAPLCAVGGVCIQILRRRGVEIISRIAAIGDVCDPAPLTSSTAEKEFPVVSDDVGRAMRQVIEEARADGDSVGGIIECAVVGLPAGLGGPMFGGMENRLSAALFAIPAVKGVEFGDGFALSAMRGSESNDPFRLKDGRIITETNHMGGILGGITNGMPLTFRVAMKPTPSISKAQKSVDLSAMAETTLSVAGRHDPCVVPRAVPCVEAAAAIAVLDAILEDGR